MTKYHPVRVWFDINGIVEPDGDGFHAFCPALPGCHTYGETQEEALTNLEDAATAYIRSLVDHQFNGFYIPGDAEKILRGMVGWAVRKEREACAEIAREPPGFGEGYMEMWIYGNKIASKILDRGRNG